MTTIKELNLPDIAEKLGLTVTRNKTICPFCGSEKTPALHLYNDHYHCFSCAAHGDAVDLVMAVLHCSFSEAYKFATGQELPNMSQPRECDPEEMIFDVPIDSKIEFDPDTNSLIEKPVNKRIKGLKKSLRLIQEIEEKKLFQKIREILIETFERSQDPECFEILKEFVPPIGK